MLNRMLLVLLLSTISVEARAESVPNRFGNMSIIGEFGEQKIIYNGRLLDEETGLSFERKVTLPSRDVILIMKNSGGTACPAKYVIFDISATTIISTPSFGTCSDLATVTATATGMIVSLPKFRGPHERGPAARERRRVFVYGNGRLTENGKPVPR
jgi:hypothetical protein